MKVGISILLYIVASVLAPFINLLGMLVAVLYIALAKKLKGQRKVYFSMYFENNAISKDQHGNAASMYIFNFLLLKRKGEPLNPSPGHVIPHKYHSFGNPDETISYVLGKNKQLGSLTIFGMFWAWLLNAIDRNHVEDAVESEESE